MLIIIIIKLSAAAEHTDNVDFLSNGFKIRYNGHVNVHGEHTSTWLLLKIHS